MAVPAFVSTEFPGLLRMTPGFSADDRGSFVKTYTRSAFAAQGLATEFAEEYVTTSHRGVVRGMHFQLPPHDHDKVVICLSGSAFDVALDLRVGSPTFGRAYTCTLEGERGDALYIPRGFAHGFCALSDDAMLAYKVTSEYAPAHDAGLLWSSVPGVQWPVERPVLSERDTAHPAFSEFASPFVFGENS